MNKIYSLLRKSFAIAAFAALVLAFQSCKDESIIEHGLDAEQLAAGRIAGSWGSPSNIITPNNLPDEIFGDMRLVFTTDADGYPDQFIAKGSTIVFSSEAGNWSVDTSGDIPAVTLTDVVPVDEFTASAGSNSLIISFYMGWENTDTGETGEGEFSATLSRL